MKSVVIGTAGHIDHGKSSLVLALTGTDPDRLKEEKARGITIDLGFARYETDGVTFAFIDVPGHERFVKNMLAGASGIDAVLLVVAADESVKPQTREHFDICRLLEVKGGIVALTKADLADPDMLELARLEIRELVAGSFLAEAPIIPVSVKSGAGLDALRAALASLAAALPERETRGATRLPIDRAFTMKGFGTVVTGTLVAGRIAANAELEILPAGRRVKVRTLQVHGTERAAATAGQRVAVNLGGVEVGDLRRGDTLAAAGAFAPTRRFDAAIELLPGARPLRHGARVRFHQGTTELLGRVSLAAAFEPGAAPAMADTPRADPAGAVIAPSELLPEQCAFVRMRLERSAVLTRGDRFIVRAYSPPVTIGGGYVLDPDPPRSAARTPQGLSRFMRLDPASLSADRGETDQTRAEAVALMLREAKGGGLGVDALTIRAGIAPEQVRGFVDRLLAERRAVLVAGNLLVDPTVHAEVTEQLLAALEAYHRAEPLSAGMPRGEARMRVFERCDPAVCEDVIATLVREKRIVGQDRLALGTHRVSLSATEIKARDAVEQAFRSSGLKPPDASAVPVATGLAADLIERMIALLIRQKVLVRIDSLIFHREALEQLRSEIAALKRVPSAGAHIDVGTFKERYGISRKFAIPLLEYLDRERVTRRVGDSRVIL